MASVRTSALLRMVAPFCPQYIESGMDEYVRSLLAVGVSGQVLRNVILNYCRTKVRFGVVEAINANIKTLFSSPCGSGRATPAIATW